MDLKLKNRKYLEALKEEMDSGREVSEEVEDIELKEGQDSGREVSEEVEDVEAKEGQDSVSEATEEEYEANLSISFETI